jgi:hypothetical protein
MIPGKPRTRFRDAGEFLFQRLRARKSKASPCKSFGTGPIGEVSEVSENSTAILARTHIT